MALLEFENIKEAAVVAKEDNSGEQQLVAYLVCAAQPEPDVSSLRRALSQKLPDYMIPSAFVFLESMPLNPNGKVDRKALPEPDYFRSIDEEDFVEPQTPMEKKIAEVWQEVLGISQISVNDNFFDIGGHSLLALKSIIQLEKTIELRLQPREIAMHTLGQLATLCEQRQNSKQKFNLKNFSKVFKGIRRIILGN